MSIKLRKVQSSDCGLIWNRVNDPDMRANSFSSGYISWKDHVRWFNLKLNDPNCFFYIAINKNETPVGQIRFERKEKEVTISISVDKKFQGRGYGCIIIKLGVREFFKASNDQVVHAYIKGGNEISKRVFLKAGFRMVGEKNSVICLKLQRDLSED